MSDGDISVPGSPSLHFRRRHRLSRSLDYRAAYKQGKRKPRGPLLIFARPNGLDHARLGLSVPRRVGNAVERNRVKRRLREAFRLLMPSMPPGYDVVISVRPHAPLPMAEYQGLLESAWRSLDGDWRRHAARQQSGSDRPGDNT
ncbi:MAG: ribonuclease P protein component [Phycisphaerales bacterium]